ncbi:uncharacterized protein LOC105801265 [Gossypium raimondii]|uniref:uncharacterized protein LOC105801265 n=1 Tax=Gossypium raimondii TaxID=29730 RepID=UPI00063AFB46|nr:uncharacterized protein LOC105801265 [Gossypium raimondii]
MCVDYRDLNKASLNDNFLLPHIDTLVDNTTGYSLFSFMNGFSKYDQIKMHPEDMEKTTFVTIWEHFGFIASEKGIEIDPDKVKAIQELPLPHSKGGAWDEECQKTFDKVKHYLSNAPVLMPPSPDKPLILYLAVFGNSMECVLGQHDESGRKERAIYYLKCVLGQHDESGRKERAIYYLSKKFAKCETRYPPIEKLFFFLNLDNPKTETIHVVLYDLAYLENRPSKNVVKGSAIADFLANRALEDYEPMNFDFPNEDLMYITTTEEDAPKEYPWKLNFDRASNGDHYPFTSKLDFDYTNNMAEYEACIMGIRETIERKIKVLEVCGDSALVIYQLKGEWETRDSKLIDYRRLVLELIKEFDNITFCYLPRDKNKMADTLATLASMVKVNKQEDLKPIHMSIYEAPSYCYNIEEEKKDNHSWYHDILQYVKNREYPD